MTYDDIFAAYYNLYRLEAETPGTTDDEYIIGMRLANEAVVRWENYDHTYWKELFTTLSLAGEPVTLTAGVLSYDAPDDFKEAGGLVKVYKNGSLIEKFRIIEPQDVQFQSESGKYCYFTGNPAEGYTLHLSAVSDQLGGCTIDYVYYKRATQFTDGETTTEMGNPYFIVHRMLANRFRGSRNPYAADAKADAEDVLKTMQLENISGNWADPWKLADNSGSMFGV